jgi:hypothetical protein
MPVEIDNRVKKKDPNSTALTALRGHYKPNALSKGSNMRMILSTRSLLLLTSLLVLSAVSAAQVGVSVLVNLAPPELPVYEQPICPGEGYIWTPGYWAWDGDDYYWVPGTWVEPPAVGYLWTPGYWAWNGQGFIFSAGYWGPAVGFYGGIDYGFGYFGHGYEGGRWDHDHFYYNRSVNNINVTQIHNVYNTTVVNNTANVARVSYNGGNGGINVRPTAQEENVTRERHIAPTAAQTQHIAEARSNPQLKASTNRGKPSIAATPKPAAFNDRSVVPAREGGRYLPPAENHEAQPRNSNGRPSTVVHPNDIPPAERSAPSHTGNTKLDQKYQQQQEKLYKQQDQARQKLQKQQDSEHQKLEKQQADQARKQQSEQRHQQQTQQLMQKQTQQQQQLQKRQERPSPPPHSAPAPPPNNKPPHEN